MTESPVTRETLANYDFGEVFAMKKLELRRISLPANLIAGSHRHNGPVFGVIEKGSALVQIGDGPVQHLSAGQVFYEPHGEVISKFDAGEEGLTFLACFPLEAESQAEIEML